MAPKNTKAAAALKTVFKVDYSKPVADSIFDAAEFEKYLHDHGITSQGMKIAMIIGSTEGIKQAVENGLGISIISTSKGVMTGKDARRGKLGGEVLCEVW